MSTTYGRRLLLTVLHHEADLTPQRTFCIVPRNDEIGNRFREITFQQVSHAVNYLSHWLSRRFDDRQDASTRLTLAYIGAPDLCYCLIVYATIQCRWTIFLPSPRNPKAITTSLIKQTGCNGLVYSGQLTAEAEALRKQSPSLRIVHLPPLEELLKVSKCKFEYSFSYSQIYQEPIVIFHSSGSTGRPKPVTYTHGALATFDVRNFPTVNGRINHDSLGSLRYEVPGERIFDIFPPYHLAGFTTKILVPLYNLTVPIFGPSKRPPSGSLTKSIIQDLRPRCVVLPPVMIEMIYHEPNGKEILSQIDAILYAGGPLADAVGTEISSRTRLCQSYGSTEIGQIRQLFPEREDWAYLEFHPCEKFEFRRDAGELYELVVFSSQDVATTSALYHTLPDIREYCTKDLFEPHPNKPGLWKYKARKDDILVFSSGEKLNPIPFETAITSAPGVTGALITGHGRSQSVLLVELASDASLLDPLEEIWSHVEVGNLQLPAYGRVARNMIIVADKHRPFARAGKGSVVRRMTERLYEDDVQILFGSVTAESTPGVITLSPSMLHANGLREFVRSILGQVSIGTHLRNDQNFYAYGMDSIKTAEMLSYLKASLRGLKTDANLDWLQMETIYTHSTVDQLVVILTNFLVKGKRLNTRDRVAEMNAKIAKYANDLPTSSHRNERKARGGLTIAVTGTTGYLGRYLIKKLSQNTLISRIYCLDRNPRDHTQLIGRYHSVHLVPIQIDFSRSNLGLCDLDQARLADDCELIIHNAWQVDFNLPLDRFDDHLNAVRELIALSTRSETRMRIVFISSISATGVWSTKGSAQQIIPESTVEDLSSTMENGYAESKRVAEHILEAAVSHSGIPATVVRLGELVPGKDDTWADLDVTATFLRTCKAIRRVPSDFTETVDWISVDWAASILNDLVDYELKHSSISTLRVLNLVNPNPYPWSELVPVVGLWCGTGTEVVSMIEWVEELRKSQPHATTNLSKLPALRMLLLFEKMSQRGYMHKYAMACWREINPAVESCLMICNEQTMTLLLSKL